jgi:S-DNA-T family DNA segregation ATPase FtsK/SpoIIIE
MRLRGEVLGLLMAATGVFVLVALWPYDPAAERTLTTLNRVGIVGAYSAYYLYSVFGYGALLIGGLFLVWGGSLFFGRASRRTAAMSAVVVAVVIVCLALMGVVGVWQGGPAGSTRAGWVGNAAAAMLVDVVGVTGAFLVCTVALALLVVGVFRVSLAGGVETGVEIGRAGGRQARAGIEALGDTVSRWREERSIATEEAPALEIETDGAPAPEALAKRRGALHPISPSATGKSARPVREKAVAAGPVIEPEGFLPPIDLLAVAQDGGTERSRDDLEAMGQLVVEKLHSFNVEGEVVAIHSGPVLTRFEIKPAPGVKVNRIANLSNDLALAMRAQRIRIVAPIPGRGAVGIEVPNPEPRVVTIREMLESDAWGQFRGRLPLVLGREIAGAPVVTDLARMPHLLIAGATGSGKSVCINAIVTSLLYRYGPDEVRFIMIDPKMLELITYNDIPHLLHPVVVEHRQSAKALKWTVAEMERRYRLLAANGVRSLDDYNSRARQGDDLRGIADDDGPSNPLPFIVVVIDELADLMLTVQNEIEEPLARLAQMARAVGVHLVLATQRPSVNVITGVIKANFPSRISFQVSSKIDSRTILDANGAEQLLGDGDMLYLPADRAEPVRIQGAFVSTEETSRIVEYLRAAGQALGADEIAPQVDIIAEASELEMAALDERDELFLAAARIVVDYEQGSTSLLQRRLKVGYSRAARILDQLEQANIVGPPDGTKPRRVLVTVEDLEPLERDTA